MSQLENTQTVVLQQTDGKKIYLDIQHSTDWVGVGAIVLSLLAFMVTIIIVRSSTKENIENNKFLVKSQKDIKDLELKYLARNDLNNKLRNSFSLLLGAIDIYITEGLSLNTMIMRKMEDNEIDHLFQIRESQKNKIDELCLRVRSLVIQNELYFNELPERKIRAELQEVNSIMNEILDCNIKNINAKSLFFKLSDQSLVLKGLISEYLVEQKRENNLPY